MEHTKNTFEADEENNAQFSILEVPDICQSLGYLMPRAVLLLCMNTKNPECMRSNGAYFKYNRNDALKPTPLLLKECLRHERRQNSVFFLLLQTDQK